MTDKSGDITEMQAHNVCALNSDNKIFTNKTARLNALACNNIKQNGFNLQEAINNSESDLKALHTNGALQEMLAAQILSAHNLQQSSMAMANASDNIDNKKYFTNAAIKLANSFTQQANLLSKLQGNGGQKIVIEHVTVNSGGQAALGNFNGGTPVTRNEK